jgi:4-amino-4-deoxy-L-arabinose transferase-like glycosyltransferase
LTAAYVVLGVLTVLRLIAAFAIPPGGDEAYYWTWSLHPAYGYTDHPPMVAWLITAGRSLGPGFGFVRLPFVVAEAVAALAVGRAARALSGDARAGAIATLLFALIPQTKLAIGVALPDGPYVAAWALALWAAAALERTPAPRIAAGLGLALAATVLSRWFGWALVFGVAMWALAPARRARLARPLAGALAIVVLAYVPFLVWNASVGWENVAFTFQRRQSIGGASLAHLVDVSTVRFLLFGGLVALLTWLVAWRRARVPLVLWTALPLPAALFVLSFATTTESYWIIGPAASLCVAAGIALVPAGSAWRTLCYALLGAGTAYTTIAALFLTLPERGQAAVLRNVPAARGPLFSKVHMYPALADRLRALQARDGATILTDRFETAAQLRWYGVDARIAVPIPQQAQWSRWHAGDGIPARAYVVTSNESLANDAYLAARLPRAYAVIGAEMPLTFSYAGQPEDTFYVTPVSEPRTAAAGVLAGL